MFYFLHDYVAREVSKMPNPDFAKHLSKFLAVYLPGIKNVSRNTILSYRDSFKLLLIFFEECRNRKPEKLSIAMLTETVILEFLDWLELRRGCCPRTRNQRLAAICSFMRYVQKEYPGNLQEIQKILAIPQKKSICKVIRFLSPDEISAILSAPDLSKKSGRRDAALLSLMYDSGARVQEIADLTVANVRTKPPAVVTLQGKGNKERCVPIMEKTARLLESYLSEFMKQALLQRGDSYLFLNHQKKQLGRKGIDWILKKYVKKSRESGAVLPDMPITCHVFRHSKAAHMLQAGIPLVYIRDFLGHSSVTTTEIYARLNDEIKRKAIESAYPELQTPEYPSWLEDADLMTWLENLV
jgi:integrase/recombinase XerD